MLWIKKVVLDLVVLAVTVAATVLGHTWAWWFLIIYTPLLLILKVLVFAGGSPINPGHSSDNPPELVFHLIYGASVALLLYAGYWLLAAGWAVIWLLSFLIERRRGKPASARTARS